MPGLITDISNAVITNQVLLDGQVLTGQNGLVSVTIEKVYNKISSAQMVFTDGDVVSQDFNLSNQVYTLPGKTIEVKAGYDNQLETIFKGVIVSHSIKVRNSKSQLVLYAKDKSVAMALTKKSNYYLSSVDSDIITQIISSEGLVPEVDTTTTLHDQIVQAHCSNWDFIVQRAEANGLLVNTEDGKVSVKKPTILGIGLITAAYGQNIFEFDAEIDARNQIDGVKSVGWDVDNLALVEEAASEPNLITHGNVESVQLASDMKAGDYEQLHGGIHNENELRDWANARLLKARMSKVLGRVKITGTSAVKLGDFINLSGVGERFNGQVFVSGVRQEIVRGGWWTDIQFGLPNTWHAQEYNSGYNDTANIISEIHGLHVGLVTTLEGDPESNARIKVKLPLLKNNDEGIWARVSTLDAGSSRGTVILPEIGDEVIVGFVQNDPRCAVVLGMLHSKKNAVPTDLTPSDDNHLKGWVTRSEMKLIFDDDKKTVTLSTPGGSSFMIDDDAKKIEIKDLNGNTITMNESGIEINSIKDLIIKATADVKVEGINIKQEASAEWAANGSAGSKLESSGSTTVKGSIVMIN